MTAPAVTRYGHPATRPQTRWRRRRDNAPVAVLAWGDTHVHVRSEAGRRWSLRIDTFLRRYQPMPPIRTISPRGGVL